MDNKFWAILAVAASIGIAACDKKESGEATPETKVEESKQGAGQDNSSEANSSEQEKAASRDDESSKASSDDNAAEDEDEEDEDE
jgi:hypothetical protein